MTAPSQPELFPPTHETNYPQRLLSEQPAERVYYDRWVQEQDPGRRQGVGLLGWILAVPTSPAWARAPWPVSRRDAFVAASLVQWLGTNIGHGFVMEAERQIGREEAVLDAARAQRHSARVAYAEQAGEAPPRAIFVRGE